MKKSKGFSLIEMVVMIAVSGVIFAGTASAMLGQWKAMTDNRDYLVALQLAQRQMAIMNYSTYPAVAAEAQVTGDSDFPNFIVTQEVTSEATSGADSLQKICVRVRKDSISGQVWVTLYTYRTNVLTFGDGL